MSESDIKDQITSLSSKINSNDKDDLIKLMQLNKELIRKTENNYLPIDTNYIEE